jgi:hypothetical protein
MDDCCCPQTTMVEDIHNKMGQLSRLKKPKGFNMCGSGLGYITQQSGNMSCRSFSLEI